jgi:PHD/YefM family antitoxin component YafN of YafNO toxin-antitoxin module
VRDKEVPQDGGLFGEFKELCYAVDENGRYVLVGSAGWEPANIANAQAWETIRAEVADTLARVRAGELSPLAYHMARHQMDHKLLAAYVGLYGWQVRRHARPGPFSRLSSELVRRYAAVFKITPEELLRVP